MKENTNRLISKNFIKSSIIYSVAGALPMASAVLLLPFYLAYLSTQDFGALALYLSTSILTQLLVTYSFDASLQIYFHDYKKDPQKLAMLVSSAFTFIVLLGIGVSLLLLLTGGVIVDYFFRDQNLVFYPYGFLAVLTGFFQSLFKVNNTFLQGREKPLTFLRSNIVSFVLVAGFTIAGLELFPNTLAGPVGGRMLAFAITGGWSLFMIYREFGIHFNLPLLRTTFSYNTYQSIYQLQQWVINYFDRFLMIGIMSELGVYDFTLKCLLALDFVISGLYGAVFPKVLSRMAESKMEGTSIEINRYYNGITATVMLMVSGAIFVLPVLLDLFVHKPGYSAASDLVPYASLFYLFRGMRFYFGLPYNTMKYSKPLPLIYLFVAGGKVLLAYFLIQTHGAIGAIEATIVGAGAEVFLLWLFMRNKFDYVFNPFKLIAGPVLLMICVLVLEPVFHVTHPWAIHGVYVVTTVVALLWFYRREIAILDFRKLIK